MAQVAAVVLWCNPWPRNFHVLQVWQKKTKKKKREREREREKEPEINVATLIWGKKKDNISRIRNKINPVSNESRSSHRGATGSAASWEGWDSSSIPGPAQWVK